MNYYNIEKPGYEISYTSIPFCSLKNVNNKIYKTNKNYSFYGFLKRLGGSIFEKSWLGWFLITSFYFFEISDFFY